MRMIANKIRFIVYKRINVHCKNNDEWALDAQFEHRHRWTIKTWEKEPGEKEIDETKEIIIRAFEFYHKHLEIPRFNLTVLKD